ncbi:MAG: PQQ-dependent sugar dehydrogenase [Novosphingobium sp.]
MRTRFPASTALAALSLAAVTAASCSAQPAAPSGGQAFAIADVGTFDEPWALAFEPGTGTLFVTEKNGHIRFLRPEGQLGMVTGVPKVDYGGQGGLGDLAFAPDYATSRTVYLSWAEAGDGGTRGAAVGRARLACGEPDSCVLEGLEVIWRQAPKVEGRGHYSHRLAFSPDGRHLFVASGERQAMTPAQDLSGNLGKIVRLNLDGTPAADNPFAARGGVAAQVWSLGHRNILGLQFDESGRLWDLEHGPAGGDELNLVKPGANYGWPVVSNGDHYDGRKIPRHATRPDFAAPAISWNPVIAPGGFVFASGKAFPAWRGQALIAGMVYEGLVRVAIDGDTAREVERIPLGKRIRAIVEGPDGALWIVEDGDKARLRKLTPKG